MASFPTDGERAEWMTRMLYVPAVCDALDVLGRRRQALHQRLRPLDSNCCSFVGRARTVQWVDANYIVNDDPYGLEIDLMDSLEPGDVIVHSTDAAGVNAPWGELMSTIAKVRGAVGCVCDSNIRDCRKIMALEFPVFYAGIRPLDSLGRGRVFAYDVPVRCGEVDVLPRELVFADFDGVVVIPADVEEQALELASSKVGKESCSRRELAAGRRLREVYDRYGVL